MPASGGVGPLQPVRRRRRRPRRALVRLAALLAVLAAGGAGLALALAGGGGGRPAALATAQRVADDWAAGRYAGMYAELGPGASGPPPPLASFIASERQAAATATIESASAGPASADAAGRLYTVAVRIRTRIFGTLDERFTLRITGGQAAPRVRWSSELAFPGLAAGESLRRVDDASPRRGVLETRDRGPLRDVASVAPLIGSVGAASGAQLAQLVAAGFPPSTPVGLDGLEFVFQDRLAGRPGGTLYAGRRVLATAAPRRGENVRTSISPTLQSIAAGALDGDYGESIIVMEPSNGQLLAAAGLPLTELQPPGSTFKIITLTGVLEAHLAKPTTVFHYATSTTIDNTVLRNSNGESCGGTLTNAFAVSCNSVFVPLGVRLGASRLLAAAHSYGFNSPSSLAIAAQSTLPPGSLINAFQVGSSAIGQAQVLATPLQMLRVAATIALVGRLPTPTFAFGPRRLFPRVVPVAIARTIRRLMTDVVRYGTGTAAQIHGVTVAGKTGTAQVSVPGCSGATGPTGAVGATGASGATGTRGAKGCPPGSTTLKDDAWFVGFAPEIHPRVAVAVLLPLEGAGGTAAAPVAKGILEEGLALTR